MYRRCGIGVALTLALGASGCGAAKAVATAPVYEPGVAKCKVAQSNREPLIIEWPAVQRTKLEALSKRGLVAVRYEGCELEVLPQCHVKASYDYTATTPQHEHVTIRNEDDLYARLPVGALQLEGDLSTAGQLNVSMTIVGTYRSNTEPTRDVLVGDCGRATHVVAGFTVGAFRFYSGAQAAVGGGVDSVLGGAGAKSESRNKLLRRAGDEDACELAEGQDTAPPFGCGALLRLEVATIGPARAAEAIASVEPPPEPDVDPPVPASEPEPVVEPEPHPVPEPEPKYAVTPSSTPPPVDSDDSTDVYIGLGLGGLGLLLVGGIVLGAVLKANEEEDKVFVPEAGGLGSGTVLYAPVVRW